VIERLDIGSGKGRCTEGGVGVDLSMKKARIAHEAGHRVVVADACNLPFADNSFQHSTMYHVLEHLNSLDEVEQVIAEARRTSAQYLHIRGPWFDADDYLAERGLALYWSTWPGHPTHLTRSGLYIAIAMLGLEDYVISGRGTPVTDSRDRRIHPVGYEAGGPYVDGEYPEKEYVEFDIPIYDELECKIKLR